jgi:hypothetical protein
LTFADLNRVKETFLMVLMGIYHIRVKYPGDEETAALEEGGSAPAAGEGDKPGEDEDSSDSVRDELSQAVD